MPILKIKQNGSWVEVWGATNTTTGSMPRLTTISIPASGWEGDASPYSQIIGVSRVNNNSKLDLLPSFSQVDLLQQEEVYLTVSNDNGVVTVFAIGHKPINDYDMQMLITDVEVIV